MKTGLQMGLICLMLMAGGCGQKAEKESKSEPANPPEKTRQTSEIIQIAEETEPKPLPERTSKPVFSLDTFSITQWLTASVKEFDMQNWAQVMSDTWIEPNRLGNYPPNLFRYGQSAFDDTHFYGITGLNNLHRIDLQTGEETISKIPEAYNERSLNQWKGKLYFIAPKGIMSLDLLTEEVETIIASKESLQQIAILDDCLFYLTQSGTVNIYHLDNLVECNLIENGVKWFSLTEGLLIYSKDNGEACIIDLIQGIHYNTGLSFSRRSYHYDRLLFTVGRPESLESQSDFNSSKVFTLQFGSDSLIVVPHYEEHITFFKGQLVGVTEGTGGKAAIVSPNDESVPFFSADAFVDLLATTPEKIAVYYYDIVQRSYYLDMKTGETESISQTRDFLTEDPRAIPPNFEITGDSLLHAQTKEGPVILSIHPEKEGKSKIKIKGATQDTTYILPYHRATIALSGFYDDLAIIRGPGGETGYISHANSHFFFCIKTGKMINNDHISENMTPFRDGILITNTLDEQVIKILDTEW